MRISLRFKFIIGFLAAAMIMGLFATLVGIYLISGRLVHEAQEKVRHDLNTAREVYSSELKTIETIVRLTAVRKLLTEAVVSGDRQYVNQTLNEAGVRENLDFFCFVDKNQAGKNTAPRPLLDYAAENKKAVSSTVVIPKDELADLFRDLPEKVYIKILPTPRAKPDTRTEEFSGMALAAVAPVMRRGEPAGFLLGGKLLNHNYAIVDKVKDILYGKTAYRGKNIGTVTIFQKDLRISTNVLNKDGSRAVGTRVQDVVYDQVLMRGQPWIDRAFVVNDWYITAYEPIRDFSNSIIGILYVGILEKPYIDMKRKIISMFLGVSLLGAVMALAASWLLSGAIMGPIAKLIAASRRLAQGDFSTEVDIRTKDEISELGKSFNFMTTSLKERDEQIERHMQEKIKNTERLATIGQLAAGVAHEINNPLGGIMVYSNLLLEDMPHDHPGRPNLEKIVRESSRCKDIVKGLLEFSRQAESRMEKIDIAEILNKAISLIERQSLFHNVRIVKNAVREIPAVQADAGQIQQVFLNILINAAEAMEGKGTIEITASPWAGARKVKIVLKDSGCGISLDNLPHIFEPFFSTKEVGKGTGLGLAISYGIIQKHGGTIEAESKPGQGTAFIIILPVAEPSPPLPQQA